MIYICTTISIFLLVCLYFLYKINLTENVIGKLLSGRYYLTLIGGIVFAYSVYRGVMPPEATASILTAIFTSYFYRQDRKNEGGKNENI